MNYFLLLILSGIFFLGCSFNRPTPATQPEKVFRIASPSFNQAMADSITEIAYVPLELATLIGSIVDDCERDTMSLKESAPEGCLELNESNSAFTFNKKVYELLPLLFPRAQIKELVPGVGDIPAKDTNFLHLEQQIQSLCSIDYYRSLEPGRYVADEPIASALKSAVTQFAARYSVRYLVIPLELTVDLSRGGYDDGTVTTETLFSLWDGMKGKLLYIKYQQHSQNAQKSDLNRVILSEEPLTTLKDVQSLSKVEDQ
ncbi:MAG: hypothetical protein OCD01_16305 [Fibrobacterales bacterium]